MMGIAKTAEDSAMSNQLYECAVDCDRCLDFLDEVESTSRHRNADMEREMMSMCQRAPFSLHSALNSRPEAMVPTPLRQRSQIDVDVRSWPSTHADLCAEPSYLDHSSVDIDEEAELQEAVALSKQPRSVVFGDPSCGICDDSVLCFVDGFEEDEVELLVEGVGILKHELLS